MTVADCRQPTDERVGLRSALFAVLGLALGTASATLLLVGSGFVLVPWGSVAALIGATSRSRRNAARVSAIYGFSVAFAFAVAGYDGEIGLAARSWFFVLLGLLGANGAVVVAVLGHWASRRR